MVWNRNRSKLPSFPESRNKSRRTPDSFLASASSSGCCVRMRDFCESVPFSPILHSQAHRINRRTAAQCQQRMIIIITTGCAIFQ
ncbi:hypothetical protein CDAR_540391 [Caerostris darwini]|uniref:Uncharacterized protein n=1 Tax=Caerostris darwini TaxID=1538125 RepID=A0AAV4WTI0_9ARAC|nr:hypothetical protein CDAR_540391 [Caerostris darwini]